MRPHSLLVIAVLCSGTTPGESHNHVGSRDIGELTLVQNDTIIASTVELGVGRKLLNSIGFVFAPDVVTANLPYYGYRPDTITASSFCDGNSPLAKRSVGNTVAVLARESSTILSDDEYTGWRVEPRRGSAGASNSVTYEALCRTLASPDLRNDLESLVTGLVSRLEVLGLDGQMPNGTVWQATLDPVDDPFSGSESTYRDSLIPIGAGSIAIPADSEGDAARGTVVVDLYSHDSSLVESFDTGSFECLWNVSVSYVEGEPATQYLAAHSPNNNNTPNAQGISRAYVCPEVPSVVDLRLGNAQVQPEQQYANGIPVVLLSPMANWYVVTDAPFPDMRSELRFDRDAFASAGSM